jgi:hypothetical protein
MKATLILASSKWLLATLASAAHADCKPVIAAWDKADATKHYALYEVKKMTQVPKGDPYRVALGDVEYQQQYERKGPLSIVKAGFSKGGHAAGSESASIKTGGKKGDLRCEPLGERKIGDEAVVGYRIRNNHGSEPDLSATDMWIGRASGTPLFTSIGPDEEGGFRWVYGNSVVPPAPGSGK